jgi:hypothetical protein
MLSLRSILRGADVHRVSYHGDARKILRDQKSLRMTPGLWNLLKLSTRHESALRSFRTLRSNS